MYNKTNLKSIRAITTLKYINIKRRCNNSDLVTQLLRFSFAITFMLSGISKAANLEATSQLIDQYCVLLGLDARFGISPYITASLTCSFEIFIGMIALNRKMFLLMLPIYILVISIFSILTCINLVVPLGGIESCGCFGELVHLNAKETFFKNIILLVASFYLAYAHKNEIISYYMNIKDNAPKLGRLFVYYAIAAMFPVCVSVYLDNDVHTHRVLLYYSSIVVCVIFTIFISKCSIITQSSADNRK